MTYICHIKYIFEVMNETEALHILMHLPKVHVRKLIAHYGSALNALTEIKWERTESCERDWALMERECIQLISYADNHYPSCLRKLPDFPLLLYIKGNLLPSDSLGLAIIGTRQCTIYGQEMAEQIGQEIAGHGVSVISGLARGIDTAAHRGALKKGRTLAFLGSGFSHLYPKENIHLAEEIAQNGAVITELPMNALPEKRHFPKRNRLVSALSQGVLLIEAPMKSGAMITMEMAHSQGKFCYALPGRADVESFRGNHFLIKNQKAVLVEKAAEMLSILLPNTDFTPKTGKSFVKLNLEEEQLIHLFPEEEVAIETLAEKTQLHAGKLNALLMGLVLKKVIREFPGKHYKKVS